MNSYNLFGDHAFAAAPVRSGKLTLYKGKHLPLLWITTTSRALGVHPGRIRHICRRSYALLVRHARHSASTMAANGGAEGKSRTAMTLHAPSFEQPIENDLTARITAMAKAHREPARSAMAASSSLCHRSSIWERRDRRRTRARCRKYRRAAVPRTLDARGRAARPHYRRNARLRRREGIASVLGISGSVSAIDKTKKTLKLRFVFFILFAFYIVDNEGIRRAVRRSALNTTAVPSLR